MSTLNAICSTRHVRKENQKHLPEYEFITYNGVILNKSLSSGGTFDSGFLFTAAVAAAAILKLIFAARDQCM